MMLGHDGRKIESTVDSFLFLFFFLFVSWRPARRRGTPEQLAEYLRDRDGVPTVENVAALLAA